MLEIERELAGADGAAAMARYDATLVALATRAKAALDRGLAPADFAKVTALADATTVARKLLRLQLRGATTLSSRPPVSDLTPDR